MKVVKINNEVEFELICERCHSTIQYSAQDTTKEFNCPVCKQEMTPTWKEIRKKHDEHPADQYITSDINSLDMCNLDYLHALNPGDSVTLHHSVYGDIAFDVCAKDYLVPDTITLVSRRCITNMKWNKNSVKNHYQKSSIRYWLNGEFLNGFSEAIQHMIKSPYWACHNYTTAKTLNDKIAIPSMTEMGISYAYSKAEGAAFTYKNIKDKFVGTVDGQSDAPWCWTRTPYSDNTSYACYFDSSGCAIISNCSGSYGVPVCFVI